ncbi:hypothetical protein [Streptomyces erythrochromogenes]|uniref:hypothetical protein n=1 Tax=Streptomyces erythrochromogenes TaxID=285574 RepID=UPI003863F6B8|nr:hypothetical protein OG364_13980 [Streptomyces erythrochromogenes]
MYEPITYQHWAVKLGPKAVPALATSTVLILGRIWNANGAEHSTGNAVLMTVLALGAAAAGGLASAGRTGDAALAGTAFALSGGLALAGVAGYADGLSLPLLLWALATTVAYSLANRCWRTDRRESLAHDRHTAARREEHAHVERVEILRAHTQIEVAREASTYATALAEAMTTRAMLPGFDPEALTRAGLPSGPTK